MRVDPRVVRLKFEKEIARLRAQETTLQARGIHLLASSDFPHVDLLFVPRRPLQVAVPAQAHGLVLPAGAMALVELPNIAARAFAAHLDLTDYDIRPPSLEFRDPWTGEPLKFETMFRALEFEQHRKAHVVLINDHPDTHKPFLCVRGIREYHEHPQHSGDDWMLYRSQLSLFSIVMSVWRVTLDLVQPQLIAQPNGIQINWAAEEKA